MKSLGRIPNSISLVISVGPTAAEIRETRPNSVEKRKNYFENKNATRRENTFNRFEFTSVMVNRKSNYSVARKYDFISTYLSTPRGGSTLIHVAIKVSR